MEEKMKTKETEAFKRLLSQFIDEVEKGKPPEEAGWVELDPEHLAICQDTRLFERTPKRARVSLDAQLPPDLLKTEEGDLFSDMQRALRIREIASRIADDSQLRTGAEISGFSFMLAASDFPVLSHRLFQEDFSSLDEWYACLPGAVGSLTSMAARKVWSVDDLQKILEPLHRSLLPAPELEEDAEGKVADRVGRVLRWDDVLNKIDPAACKTMGFLWYVDRLVVQGGVRYPESMALVQERAWSILGDRNRKPVREVREAVIEEVEKIENETREQGYAIASWHEILRVPW